MDNYIFESILRARIYDLVKETPLENAVHLSARLNNNVLLKREDLQEVFSFKIRGAYNKIRRLSEAERARGLVAASAGNHAQGVARSAKKFGIRNTIVMPKTTPRIKVVAVKALGARVILHGDTYDEANEHATAYAREHNCIYIHPYDDKDVIAGQGTIALEILRQYDGDINAIFVPVGGGGLIAGIATYIKFLTKKIKIIGVEPEDAACMYTALKHKRRTKLKQIGIFADGVAVRQVGAEPYKIARQYVDEVMLVSVDEICAAVKDIYDDNRSIAEPAGALAVAGLKKYVAQYQIENQTLVAIQSGANVNFDRLRHIAERADIGEKKEIVFAATIDEKAGSFRKFCQLLGKRQITEFNYRYADNKIAQVFVGVELSEDDTASNILEMLSQAQVPVLDMTDNEMAKQHVRYMVGGRPPAIKDEDIYRFIFPERPGALLDFLNKIGRKWNISLFHYRNHGAAYGRALVGIQVPGNERSALEKNLDKLSYSYSRETNNPAYEMFLS